MYRNFVLIIAAVFLGLAWLVHSPASTHVPRHASTILPTAQAAVQSLPCDNCPDTPLTSGVGCLAGCSAMAAIPPSPGCATVVLPGECPGYVPSILSDQVITPADRPPKFAA